MSYAVAGVTASERLLRRCPGTGAAGNPGPQVANELVRDSIVVPAFARGASCETCAGNPLAALYELERARERLEFVTQFDHRHVPRGVR